jgi:hypothetical protein
MIASFEFDSGGRTSPPVFDADQRGLVAADTSSRQLLSLREAAVLHFLAIRRLRRLVSMNAAAIDTLARFRPVMRISRASLYSWLRAYELRGAAGLLDGRRGRSGRPRKVVSA